MREDRGHGEDGAWLGVGVGVRGRGRGRVRHSEDSAWFGFDLGFGFGLGGQGQGGVGLGLDIARMAPSPVDMEAAVLYLLLTISTTNYLLCTMMWYTLTVARGHGGGDDRDQDPATDETVHGEVAVGERACLGVGVGVRVGL